MFSYMRTVVNGHLLPTSGLGKSSSGLRALPAGCYDSIQRAAHCAQKMTEGPRSRYELDELDQGTIRPGGLRGDATVAAALGTAAAGLADDLDPRRDTATGSRCTSRFPALSRTGFAGSQVAIGRGQMPGVCRASEARSRGAGAPDLYSRKDRGDGMAISTGKPNPWMPQYSNLHGLFIDTRERMTFWP